MVIFRVMALYSEAFTDYIPSGMKFRKFHATFHYPTFIKRYGAPALTYSGWWEKGIRFLVKLPYLRTGRRMKNLFKHLMGRIAFADVVRRKKLALERAHPGDTLEWDLIELDSGKKVWKLQRRPAAGAEGEDGDGRDGEQDPGFKANSWDNNGYISESER